MTNKGWECPKCGAVMAPHVECCVNCRGNVETTVTSINGQDFNFKVKPQSTTVEKTVELPKEIWVGSAYI